MAKRFLKGVVLGGLLGSLLVWMHTTPKGAKTKEELEKKLAVLWKKIVAEYKVINPGGVQDLPRNFKVALRSWDKGAASTEVKKALAGFLKKVK